MPGRIFTATAGDHGIRAPLPGDQNLNLRDPLTRGLLSAWIFNHAGDRYVPDIGPAGCNIDTLLSSQTGYGPRILVHPNGAGYNFPTSANGSTASTVTAPIKERHNNLTSGPMSIVLRVYVKSGPAGTGLFFGKASAGSVATGWGVIWNDSTLTFEFWIGCATALLKATSSAVLNNSWYDLAIVFDGNTAGSPATSQVTFYINGSAGATAGTSGSGAIIDDTAVTMKFGGDGSSGFTSANTSIAHAYLYNRTLSAADAKALAEAPYAICAQPTARRWFSLPNAGGAVQNTQPLFATQGQSVAQAKAVGVVRTVVQAAALVFSRSVAKTVLATQAQVARLTKQVATALTAAQGSTAIMTPTRLVLQALLAVQAQVATLTRSIAHVRAATQAQAGVLTRQVSVVRTATQATSALLTKQTSKFLFAVQSSTALVFKTLVRSFLATQASVATLVRSIGVVRTATQSQTALQTKQVSPVRVAVQASVALLTKQTNKALVAVQSSTALMAAVKLLIKALNATQAQVATLVRMVGVTRTTTQGQTGLVTRLVSRAQVAVQASAALLTKQTRKILSGVQSLVATMVPQLGNITYQSALYAVQSTTALVTRRVAVARLAVQAQAALLTKQTNKTLIAVQNSTALTAALKILLKALVAVQAQAALVTKTVGVARVSVQAQTAAVTKQARTSLLSVQAQVATVTKRVAKNLFTTQSLAARLTTGSVRLVALVATQASVATLSMVRTLTKALLAAQAQVVTMRRAISTTLLPTQATTALVRRAVARSAVTTQTVSALVTKTTGRTKAAVQAVVATLSRQAQPVRVAAQGQVVTQRRAMSVALRATQDSVALVRRLIRKGLVSVQGVAVSLSRFLPSFVRVRRIRLHASSAAQQMLAVALETANQALVAFASTRLAFTTDPTTFASIGSYESNVMADGPALYWRMDDFRAGGLVYLDRIQGEALAGTGGIVALQPGATVDGNASASFDGVVATYLQTGNSDLPYSGVSQYAQEAWFWMESPVNLGAPVTMGLWHWEVNNSDTANRGVALKYVPAASSATGVAFWYLDSEWSFQQVPSGTIGPDTGLISTRDSITHVPRYTFAVHTWYHVVATFVSDATTGTSTVALYLNGVLFQSLTMSHRYVLSQYSRVMTVGNASALGSFVFNPPSYQSPWRGRIDEISVYVGGVSPSATRIALHYASGVGPIGRGTTRALTATRSTYALTAREDEDQ